jgi:hypothetical protein
MTEHIDRRLEALTRNNGSQALIGEPTGFLLCITPTASASPLCYLSSAVRLGGLPNGNYLHSLYVLITYVICM